jgi:hypothetical protein
MWRLTIIPTIGNGDEEASVKPYSDAECHEGYQNRVANNHAGRTVLRIDRGRHDQV